MHPASWKLRRKAQSPTLAEESLQVTAIMSRLFVLPALICLVGCSAVTVGKCGPTVLDFFSRKQHRAMVIHPQGCYESWQQTPSPLEAERRALLLCSETHPDSDSQCRVVVTDGSLCPVTLQAWIEERAAGTPRSERECELGPPFVVNSPPGSEPPSVVDPDQPVITEALAAFGLEDYHTSSERTIVFGRSPESKSNWNVTEALQFVSQKDGRRTCALRVFSGWDPKFEYFETVFTVNLVGCFEHSE